MNVAGFVDIDTLDSVVRRVASDIASETGRATHDVLLDWLDNPLVLARFQPLIRVRYRNTFVPIRSPRSLGDKPVRGGNLIDRLRGR
jgi:hypothetical protein